MIVLDPNQRPKHAVILCHPDRTSFNAAVAARYVRTVTAMGHTAVLRDLYRLGFDPVLKADERPGRDDFILSADVAEELAVLGGCDVFTFVYPIWFGLPPAMLKGYIDRVLGAGFPFQRLRDRAPHPLLTGRKLLSFSSSGTSRQWLEEQGAWMSLRLVFDKYLERSFSLSASDHVHFSPITDETDPDVIARSFEAVEREAMKVCAGFPTHTRSA